MVYVILWDRDDFFEILSLISGSPEEDVIRFNEEVVFSENVEFFNRVWMRKV